MRHAGVIFDLDGTLVDSRLDFDAMRAETGCPEGIGLLEYADSLPPGEAQRVHEIVHQHEMAGATAAVWIPGAEAWLRALQAASVPTAILTRNSRPATELTLSRLGIEVEHVLTREDCRPKPDPQGLLMIAAAWGLPCEKLVYVGDFLYDLQAARAAGMHAWFYDTGMHPEFAPLADRVIRDFDTLLA